MKKVLACLSLAGLCACAKPAAQTACPPQATIAVDRPEPIELSPLIPARAYGLLHVRASTAWLRTLAGSVFFGASDAAETQQVIEEVAAYLREQLGVETRDLRRVTVFVVGQPEPLVAVVLHDVGGQLKGEAIGEYQGARLIRASGDGKLVAAHAAGALILGADGAVRAALDAVADVGKRLSASSALGKLVTEGTERDAFVCALDASMLPPDARMVLAPWGVRLALLALGERIRLTVTGEKEQLGRLRELVETARAKLLAELDQELAQARQKSDEPFAVVAAMIGRHQVHQFARVFAPKLDGNTLTLDIKPNFSGNATVPVAVIGVLAAVAIPQFLKYMKRAKATEADSTLRTLAGLVTTHVGEKHKLPASVGSTPALGACCAQGGKCIPDPAAWKQPTWRALGFAMDKPHYYSYSFEAKGKDFVVRAEGDLDCNGVYSLFEMRGSIVNGEIQVVDDVVRQNELE